MLKRFLLLVLLTVPATFTQGTGSTVIQPDCAMSFSFTATARYPATGFSNTTGCTDWILQYNSTGFSAVSVEVDSAADSTGTPGTWAAFTGKIADGNSSSASSGPGVNPNTATDWAYLRLSGSPAWVSVTLASKTGTGRVNGTLRGWKRTTSAGSSGGGATIPSTTNLIKGDGLGNGADSGVAATSAGIVGLFSTCSGTQYLGADGACHSAGTVTGGTCTNQVATAISNTAVPTCTTITSAYTTGLATIPTVTITSSAGLFAGTYTSGITTTGTVGQTCTLGSLNGGGTGAAATVALTGTNTIAGGTALVVTAAGSGYTSPPTSSTASAGTATCSGTAVIATSTSVAISTTGFTFNNTSGALTFVLPTITSGLVGSEFCVRNSATKTAALTLKAPASTTIDMSGANGTAAGTMVSGGALADAACVLATSTTTYVAYLQSGAWVNN